VNFNASVILPVSAGFIQFLSVSLRLPSAKIRPGQIYVSRSKDLVAELNSPETEVDLSPFIVPIDNLLEPGITRGALDALK
jgi:hypothetical protein